MSITKFFKGIRILKKKLTMAKQSREVNSRGLIIKEHPQQVVVLSWDLHKAVWIPQRWAARAKASWALEKNHLDFDQSSFNL